mgnify:CR=1 FL=1
MQKIGAHVSTAGGLLNAITNAEKIGANCLQIFSSAPQQWQGPKTFTHCEEFKKITKDKDLLPVFVHGTYLINLFSENQDNLEKSKQALIDDLNFCDHIGAVGVVFHLGSHKDGLSTDNLTKFKTISKIILDNTPTTTLLIIENAAGSGSKVGGKIEELKVLQETAESSRVSFCLDTAHAYAAGYDLKTKTGVEDFFAEIEKYLEWKNVTLFHLNDSKKELGSYADRHENIGEGKIGIDGLGEIIRFSAKKNIPLILETPGFDMQGPDLKNIEIVKSLLKS